MFNIGNIYLQDQQLTKGFHTTQQTPINELIEPKVQKDVLYFPSYEDIVVETTASLLWLHGLDRSLVNGSQKLGDHDIDAFVKSSCFMNEFNIHVCVDSFPTLKAKILKVTVPIIQVSNGLDKALLLHLTFNHY